MKTQFRNCGTSTTTYTGVANRMVMSARSNRRTLLYCAILFAIACLLPGSYAPAQTTNASLSGVVVDQTGAKIPGATIVLVNDRSRDKRSAVANGSGDFNFSGVPSGTYTLTVIYKGFETLVERGIQLHPEDNSSLPPIVMKVGAENVTVTVTAHDVMPTNGEISSLITADDIQHLATEGRDVTELVKILPGFALQPGLAGSGGLSNAAPDNEVAGPGGSLGNYAATGSPSNGVGLISDGANVQDPGAGGASTQTINMDMVEEVKVSTSNFGADTAKGPVVINAVGKSGGQDYHGSIYMIARIYQLNAQDWLVKNQGEPKPQDRYLYPGVSVGGPIRIPGTNFNRSKKLLFQFNAEDYVQRNVFSGGNGPAALRLSTVPTDCMRGLAKDGYTGAACANPGMADFSQTSLNNMFNDANLATDCSPSNTTGSLYTFANYCVPPSGHTPNGNLIVGGVFPAADFDPGAAAYLSIFPHQNRTAQPVQLLPGTPPLPSDGFDRIDLNLTNQDLYQTRGRIDYDPSQSSKLYFVYNTQQGYNYEPYTLYYNPNNTNGILRDPSLIRGGFNSQTGSTNFVRTFGPTLTNEAFAAISFYDNTFNAKNEAAQTTTALGYPYKGLLNNGSKQLPQLGYGSGIPLYQSPDFSLGQSFSRKQSVDFGDNVTKTWGAHTIKVGFYYERTANNQLSALGDTQGSIAEYGNYASWYAPNYANGTMPISPNNTIVSFLFGLANSYGQQNINPLEDMNYTAIDGYVTDTWKATRRLTLDYGVRFDHLGPWQDPHGIGPAFWEPQTYFTPATLAFPEPLNQLPGLTWHSINANVPSGVQPGRWAFVSPRAGLAFDMYGDGKTVFRGGGGMYRSHDSWNDYVNALGTPLGSYNVYYYNPTLYCVNAFATGTSVSTTNGACTGGVINGTAPTVTSSEISASEQVSVYAADPNDSQQPLTVTYSFGVTQALPRSGSLVVNYVGNQSRHLLLASGFGQNVNTIPLGGLFKPDPNPADSANYGVIATSPDNIAQIDDYRPYPFYNSIYVARHGLNSSYNSMQVTWSKWTGPFHYNLNYTWSKALGDRGTDGNGSVADATNIRNDYGIAQFDRTHVFNASYTYIMGSPFHVERIVGGFINGWEISGITNIQSGPNLQAAYGNNFQLTATTASTVGNAAFTDNKTYLGTTDILLQPIMTCNPAANLKSGQFVNGACLTLGPIGVNGPFRYPYMRGPHFFNSDLSIRKSFALHDKRAIQVRFAAFNFMNHPLTSLVAATASPLKLVIAGPGGAANPAFGISEYKEGRRVCEVELRYNF